MDVRDENEIIIFLRFLQNAQRKLNFVSIMIMKIVKVDILRQNSQRDLIVIIIMLIHNIIIHYVLIQLRNSNFVA